jgi:hypothetical protein
MKIQTVVVVSLVSIFISCTSNNTDKSEENKSSGNAEMVSRIMQNPGNYVNKQITVEGIVTHVCRHGGKRLHLSTAGSNEKLRVRTGKNIAAFERELEGSTVRISGTLTEERFDQDYIEKLRKGQNSHEGHESSEHNESGSSEGGVSEGYINELEQKIASSEEGYISEYWLTAEEVIRK